MTKQKILWVLPIVLLIYYFGIFSLPELFRDALRAGAMFYIGILYFAFWDRIQFSLLSIIISAVAFLVCLIVKIPLVGAFLFLHYAIMGVAFYLPQCSTTISKIGDSSYCIYLWGWPVQQTVVHFFGGSMNAHVNYLISIPISIILGYLTHVVIEEKCIKRMITAS